MHVLINGKKAISTKPIEIVIIITPNCLKVDKAITFFKSISKLALTPDIIIVIIEIINNINLTPNNSLKRINK